MTLELVGDGTRHHLVEQRVGAALLEREFARFDADVVRLSSHVANHRVRPVGVPGRQRQADNRHRTHCHRVADESSAFRRHDT